MIEVLGIILVLMIAAILLVRRVIRAVRHPERTCEQCRGCGQAQRMGMPSFCGKDSAPDSPGEAEASPPEKEGPNDG